MSKLAIILNTWNHAEITKRCLYDAIKSCGVAKPTVIINDNGSTDGTYEYVRDFLKPDLLFRQPVNIGNPQGVNLCLSNTNAHEYVAKIDPDFKMPQNWAARAIAILEKHPGVGIVGFHWARELEKTQARVKRGDLDISGDFYQPPGRVFGAWVMRRSLIDEVGCFKDDASSYGLWDAEFCQRVENNGYVNVYANTGEDYCEHLGIDSKDERSFKDTEASIAGKNLHFGEKHWHDSPFFRGSFDVVDSDKFDGSWSYAHSVLDHLLYNYPYQSSILEFGGGKCTPELKKIYRVTTIDNNRNYPADIYCDLDVKTKFYDLSNVELPITQLVMVDGPSAVVGALRSNFMLWMHKVSDKSGFVIDDVHRAEEAKLLEMISASVGRPATTVKTERKAFGYILPG